MHSCPISYANSLSIAEVEWSNDPRSESSHENHSRKVDDKNFDDGHILHNVLTALFLSPKLGKFQIEVSVDEGIVTLDGFVPSRLEKKAVECCIERLVGVKDIFNRLNI